MKKLFTILLTVCCLASLCACQKKVDPSKNISGGYTEEDEALDEEKTEVFNNALANYDGDTLRPVRFLGQQVVAGTNYRYLCENTKDGSYKEVTVYQDLQGNCSITSVEDYQD